MKTPIINGLLALLLALVTRTAIAQQPITNVVYVNGIQNTLEDAQKTQRKIQEVLDSSPNHPIGSRRFFVVYLVWNPVGWYGLVDGQSDLSQDTMELFIEKTAEEDFATSFQELLAPFNQSTIVEKRNDALKVVRYLDSMLPGNNSLETDQPPKINDERMSTTQRAIRNLISQVKQLGSTVVVAHSQGNLLANLAWAKLVSEYGNDAKRMMRLVNVANTSAFSIHNLNFTHAGDAGLFSVATKSIAQNPAGDKSLETIPARNGWTRTTTGLYQCPSNGTCNFTVSPATFKKMTGDIDYPTDWNVVGNWEGTAGFILDHSILLTYLSTATVPPVDSDTQGVPFTNVVDTFAGRFEDFVYAAARSIATSVTSLTCQSVLAGRSLGCVAVGENMPNGMVVKTAGISYVAEVSGGTSNRREFVFDTSTAGTFSVSLAGPSGAPIYQTAQVVVGTPPTPPARFPDLVVQNASFSPTSVAAGNLFQVAFTVVNNGTSSAAASTATIRVNQSTTSSTGSDIATVSVPSLAPGASTSFASVNVAAPATPGTYRLWVVADSGATSGEGVVERANNDSLLNGILTATGVSTFPDLVVQNIAFSPTSIAPSGLVAVSFDIANLGSAFAALSTSVVRINQSTTSAAGTNLASVSVGSLAGGGRASFSANVAAPATAGSYRVWVIADNNNTSGQNSAAIANDIVLASGTLTVGAPAQPDLIAQNVSFSPSTVTTGGNVLVQFSVSNQGTSTAGASTAVVRINQSTASSTGTDLALAAIPSLGAGVSNGLTSLNVVAPTVPGNYRVWVVVDRTNTAGQSAAAIANDAVLATAALNVNAVSTGPVVDSIIAGPAMLTVGTPAVFSVNGTNLQFGYVLTFPGCIFAEVNGGSSVLRQFACTLTQAGTSLAGTLSTASGSQLATFTQTVQANVVVPGPGGLYVGYYAEDPITNPEDPGFGALYFSVPASNGPFAGAMYFTVAACQTNNVGAISGSKSDAGITGSWSGTVDGILQSGGYSGSYGSTLGSYVGSYTVSGGKQFVTVPNCLQYFVAPKGTWEATPIGGSVPSTFALSVNGTIITWTAPVGSVLTLVTVIDEADALAGSSNAVKFQNMSALGSPAFNLASVVGLTVGRTYIVGVTTSTINTQRTGVSSVRVTR